MRQFSIPSLLYWIASFVLLVVNRTCTKILFQNIMTRILFYLKTFYIYLTFLKLYCQTYIVLFWILLANFYICIVELSSRIFCRPLCCNLPYIAGTSRAFLMQWNWVKISATMVGQWEKIYQITLARKPPK